MDIQAKAVEYIKACEEYTDIDGVSYAEMEANNWDSLLDTAQNKIYREVFHLSMNEALGQDWHDSFIDAVCELKNSVKS